MKNSVTFVLTIVFMIAVCVKNLKNLIFELKKKNYKFFFNLD